MTIAEINYYAKLLVLHKSLHKSLIKYTGGTLSAKPLSEKRPLSAKLFRAKFNHPKVQLAQNSVL